MTRPSAITLTRPQEVVHPCQEAGVVVQAARVVVQAHPCAIKLTHQQELMFPSQEILVVIQARPTVIKLKHPQEVVHPYQQVELVVQEPYQKSKKIKKICHPRLSRIEMVGGPLMR